MSFFQKDAVNEDRRDEIVSDINEMAERVESFRQELDTYKSKLERIASDLEDAETPDEIDAIQRRLNDGIVPDGYEDHDASLDGISEELDECKQTESKYEEWQEEISGRLRVSVDIIHSAARGYILPSSKAGPYQITKDDDSVPRIVRPTEPPGEVTTLPFTAEYDAWIKALRELADRAGRIHHTDEVAAMQWSAANSAALLGLITEFMVVRQEVTDQGKPAGGFVKRENSCKVLPLMWFVDDLLQAVNKHMNRSTSRVVVTTVDSLMVAHRVLTRAQDDFAEGCSQIDESIPATR